MPIRSLNSIFRGGSKVDTESAPSTKRQSRDVKHSSFNLAPTAVAPLTPPISPFYQSFQGPTVDLTHDVAPSACVTISGPLPDDVFAMIVSQQQRDFSQQCRAFGTDRTQPSTMLPSRSSSLAPSLASSTSSASTTASFSGPATPTWEASSSLFACPSKLQKAGDGGYSRSGDSTPMSRPRNQRAGSRESMTERGVSWGTKRSLSERTLCLEKREASSDTADEDRDSFASQLTGALVAERAGKNPGFRWVKIMITMASPLTCCSSDFPVYHYAPCLLLA